MFAWLQKNVLIPLCFLPLSSPQCPPATELGDACLGLDMLCFKFPGNLALALPRGRVLPASQAPGLCHGGQRAGSSPMLWHGSAVPAENNHQPPRLKCKPTPSLGASWQPCTPQTANLSLHWSDTPVQSTGRNAGANGCPWAASGQRDACFTHPQGMQAPSAGSSGQEMWRLVQVPVSCRRRH